ncbi:MAG: hypothetical protein IJV65_05510 [Kiritimatiellae bacterium]|nr:hypothetical protein [Kiritimatiellia bacterium]
MTLEEFESALDGVLADADRALEARRGERWPLHPARPPAGAAANPRYDGLFRVTAAFTAGFGSEKGPGYLLRAEPATLARVPAEERAALEDEAAALVREGLGRAFPGRELRVERDGGVYKIFGDLSLG